MPRPRRAVLPRLLGLLLALGAAPVLAPQVAQATGAGEASPVPAAAATARIVVNRDASGQILPPGLSRHVDTFCDGTDEGPRVEALYVREESAPNRYAASRRVIAAELAYIDDVLAVSSAATGGGRRVRWVTDASCAPAIREVIVPDGALSGFDATRAALEADGHDRADRKYLAFADVPQGRLSGGACGQAYKIDDDSPSSNDNDGTRAQHARVDRDCWSVREQDYLSAALHELLHTLGALQDSAPNASGAGHCTDAADVMCYDDTAAGGAAPRGVCPAQERWQLDCGKDDYFHTDPPPGSYLATHWNVADSSFLAPAAVLSAPPTGTVGTTTSRTVAGEVARLDAAVPTGASVRWSLDDPRCDDAGAARTGPSFSVRCFTAGVVEVDATILDSGVTASHLTVPVTFAAAPPPYVELSAPSITGAGTAFGLSAAIRHRRSGTWTTTFYARHPACSVRSTGAAAASVTCGAGAVGSRVVVGARARRAEDGLVYDRSTSVPIQAAGFPTVRVDGPSQVAVGEAGAFRASVSGASAASYAWRSRSGFGDGSRSGAAYTVRPPLDAGRTTDTVELRLVLSTGQPLTITTGYEVRPDLSTHVAGPTRVAAGRTGTYRATTNLPATIEWSVQQHACTVAPDPSGASAVLRCDDAFLGDAVLTATATRQGQVAGERIVVRAGGAAVLPKQQTRTVLRTTRRGFKAVVVGERSRVADAAVVLRVKPPGRRWTRVAVARTNRRGAAVFRVRTQRRAVYVAVTRGGAQHVGSTSARVRTR